MVAHSRISVRYPGLFVGFLDEEPILNPYYVQTRAESENAVCRYCCLPHKRWRDEFLTTTSTCDLSPSQAKAIRECDFAYFAAVMAPFADEHKFRTICDWGNWIFPYDDLFDNGTMRNVPDQAIAAMNMLMASFDASHKHELGSTLHPDMKSIVKLVLFHTRIWHSIELNASLDVRRRYTAAMEEYCTGTLAQVQQTTLPGLSPVDEVLLRRCQSVFFLPLFALVEFAHDINLPDEVYDRDLIRDIRALGIDITMLHNDLISYHKEESEGVPHNVIAAYRESGKTAQEAVDLVGVEIRQKSLLLEHAIEEVSGWASPWQYESMRYVQGVKDVIKANLYWSLHSDRFLSNEQKIRLQTTSMIEVSASPSYLCDTKSTLQWPLSSPDAPKPINEAFRIATLLDGKTVVPMNMEIRAMTLHS